jgi:hypothetical protein
MMPIGFYFHALRGNGAAASPSAADLAQYGTLTAHLCKTLKMIGLKRVPRDVTPTLQSYLKAVSQPDAPDPQEDAESE